MTLKKTFEETFRKNQNLTILLHGMNDFAERSKTFAGYKSEK